MTVRENLTRSVPFEMRDAGPDGGDGLTLDGYAAVFGERTLIDSWEGTFYEEIRKGAFRKSIRERTPVMQFDHGRHPLVGSIPIGTINSLSEDDKGLAVAGRLADNWLIEPVRDAIRDGAVDGMSFRFSVVREEWRDAEGKTVKPDELSQLLWSPGERGPLVRTLTEVKLHELGPVVFPAYDGTSVGVRAKTLAQGIRTDDELIREVRAALAREIPVTADTHDLDDPEVRREVARALLFGSPFAEGGLIEPAPLTRTTDAPLETEHPSQDTTTDAPLPDEHPSQINTLRDQISQVTKVMRERLALIEGK